MGSRGGSTCVIDGRYRLLHRLDRGRLGDIFQACVDGGAGGELERSVAVQIIDREFLLNHAFFDKLRRGYAASRAFPHRNIVELEELGRDGKTAFLVMERLEGVSLRFLMSEGIAFSESESMAIIGAVGGALSHLHARSMVHGALTAGSVFITEDYDVKLVDIVPAVPASGLPTRCRERDSGSPSAPDAGDDVHGLASVAYELLTGRHPFNHASEIEARRQEFSPPAIRSIAPRRRDALMHALAPERDRRTGGIAEFLHELGVTGLEQLNPPREPAVTDECRASSAANRPGPRPRDHASSADVARLHRRKHRQRPAWTATLTEYGRGDWLRRAFILTAASVLAAVVWLYREPIGDIAAEKFGTLATDIAAGFDDPIEDDD